MTTARGKKRPGNVGSWQAACIPVGSAMAEQRQKRRKMLFFIPVVAPVFIFITATGRNKEKTETPAQDSEGV